MFDNCAKHGMIQTVDTYVGALKEKQQVVMKELEALRSQLTDLAERMQVKEAQLKNIAGLLTLEGATESPTEEVANATPSSPPNGSAVRRIPFLAAAAQILEKRGKPMHYRKLAEVLAADRVYVPGRNPAANLVTHLSRDSRFRRVRRGTYGLQEWTAKSVGDRKPAQPD
jgi:hypothetical protein